MKVQMVPKMHKLYIFRWHVAGNRWQGLNDRWQTTGDIWHMIDDMWQMTHMSLNILCDTGQYFLFFLVALIWWNFTVLVILSILDKIFSVSCMEDLCLRELLKKMWVGVQKMLGGEGGREDQWEVSNW